MNQILLLHKIVDSHFSLHTYLFTLQHCKKSCNVCAEEIPLTDLSPPSSDLEKNLIALEKKLKNGEALSLDPAAKKAQEGKTSSSPVSEAKESTRPQITARTIPVAEAPKQNVVLPVSSPRIAAIPSTKSKKELIVRCYR